MFSNVNSRNVKEKKKKKKKIAFLAWSPDCKHYIRQLYACTKWCEITSHLIHFSYSILELKLHYQENPPIKFDNYVTA